MTGEILKKTIATATAVVLLTAPAPIAAESLIDPNDYAPPAQHIYLPAPSRPTASRIKETVRYEFYGSVSAYCSRGIMASGKRTYVGAAAAKYDIPMHAHIWVAGVGNLEVEDRGQPGLFAVDVFMSTCKEAIFFGRSTRLIKILGN
jgi:3D (Asp-Asp-Asp) domain-containing protein